MRWVYAVMVPYNVFSADISNLADILLDIHHVAPKWKAVGLLLRLHPSELELIEANHVKEGVMCCLHAVVDKWLKRSYDTATHGLPSWKLLVAAIAHPVGGNNPALAEEIARKHNGKCNNTPASYYIHVLVVPGMAKQTDLRSHYFLDIPVVLAVSHCHNYSDRIIIQVNCALPCIPPFLLCLSAFSFSPSFFTCSSISSPPSPFSAPSSSPVMSGLITSSGTLCLEMTLTASGHIVHNVRV